MRTGASSSSFDKYAQVRVSSYASNTRSWPVHETTPIVVVFSKPPPTVISSPGRAASCPVASIRAGVPSRSATLQPGGQATSMSTRRLVPAAVPMGLRTTRQFVEVSISRVPFNPACNATVGLYVEQSDRASQHRGSASRRGSSDHLQGLSLSGRSPRPPPTWSSEHDWAFAADDRPGHLMIGVVTLSLARAREARPAPCC